ncbi:hypothetical protein JW960_17330 [candidate division KSB1 bacterium]|nr:hypothetical protein [candidate division KSB1 bacterium]
MDQYQIEAIVTDDGILTLNNVPFHAGDKLEITIRKKTIGKKYPLRGKPFTYNEPFMGIADEDWEALL